MTGAGTAADAESCPGVTTIVSFLDGDLAPRERARLEVHLAGCQDCRQLISALAPDAASGAHLGASTEKPAGAPAPASASPASFASTEPAAPPAGSPEGMPVAIPGVGQVVAGKYRVERVLGQGGMGVVLEALDLTLRRRVAIKMLLPSGPLDRQATVRFLREARVAAQLTGEHVARVLDHGMLPGGPFVVLEFLDGQDLSALIKQRGAVPVGEAIDLLCQAGAGLAEVHAHGIVHRDLKPANFFVNDQGGVARVKLLDFGIAKADNLDSRQHALTAGAFLGSPLYASPEQLQDSSRVDARSDLWSFGCVAYELLTGRPPFDGDSLTSLLAAIVTAEPTPPRTLAPAVPPDVERIVLQCLRKSPGARPASIGEVLAALAPHGVSGESPLLAGRVGRLSLPPSGAVPPASTAVATATPAVALTSPAVAPLPAPPRRLLLVGLLAAGLLLAGLAWRATSRTRPDTPPSSDTSPSSGTSTSVATDASTGTSLHTAAPPASATAPTGPEKGPAPVPASGPPTAARGSGTPAPRPAAEGSGGRAGGARAAPDRGSAGARNKVPPVPAGAPDDGMSDRRLGLTLRAGARSGSWCRARSAPALRTDRAAVRSARPRGLRRRSRPR